MVSPSRTESGPESDVRRMSQFLDKLNLRPQEKRLVVLGSAVLFLVLNLWFVWPHAGDLKRVRSELDRAEGKLASYQQELSRTNEYAARLEELEGQAAEVLPEERSTLLMSQIQAQAAKSGISWGRFQVSDSAGMSDAQAEEFFAEKTVNIGINPTDPAELIDFLLALASGDLVIRVKELDLKPDNTKTKLTGSMRLIANFQKSASPTGRTTQAQPARNRKS